MAVKTLAQQLVQQTQSSTLRLAQLSPRASPALDAFPSSGSGSSGGTLAARLAQQQAQLVKAALEKARDATSAPHHACHSAHASYCAHADLLPPVSPTAQEAAIMSGIRHPNIVLYMGAVLDPPCLVMELASRGSLLAVLHSAKVGAGRAVASRDQVGAPEAASIKRTFHYQVAFPPLRFGRALPGLPRHAFPLP